MAAAHPIRHFPDMARVWCRATPDKAALIDPDRVVTYAELDQRSNRIAHALIDAGITAGSHIGFLGKNSAAFFEIWIGVTEAGCALAPMNWRNAPPELAALAEDANVPLIFAGDEFREIAQRVCRHVQHDVMVVAERTLDQWCSGAA